VGSALLIDGGQSGSRGRYVPDGTAVSGPGLPRRGRDYGPLRSLLVREVDVVAAGLSGFDGDAAAVARAVRAPVVATNDAVIAYLGALGAEPGVVLVAGTGVIALAADGRRADGWGTLLGDDGGGYWIGRRGLALALRARDRRRGGSAALLERAVARFGEPLIPAVYDAPDPVAAIASFTPDVADAARAGDAAARGIWAAAAGELADTVRALAGDGPVAYSGGLFAAGDVLLDPLRAQLPALRAPLGDALDGAARLLDRPPLFADLIVEASS